VCVRIVLAATVGAVVANVDVEDGSPDDEGSGPNMWHSGVDVVVQRDLVWLKKNAYLYVLTCMEDKGRGQLKGPPALG
jgi:hypothetical protein